MTMTKKREEKERKNLCLQSEHPYV